MLLVTGGAGFIGSNLVAALNDAGRTDIVVNDVLGSDAKWRNLRKRRIADFVPPADLLRWLDGRKLDAVFHLGAISDTQARDGDAVFATNLTLSVRLLDWCAVHRVPFLYASSAATYGDGTAGFADDQSPEALARLRPLNLYGASKHLFDRALIDRAARGEPMPPQWVGFKFFNVFGPNEYHKGTMASLVARVYDDARAGQPVRLFRSHRDGIADGDQRRDFIYVDDAVRVMLWAFANSRVSGLFNVGTGAARSFRELIESMFAAMGMPPDITYVDMPPALRSAYQYFTQAEVDKLRSVGYDAPFTALEDAVGDYVGRFLSQDDRYR